MSDGYEPVRRALRWMEASLGERLTLEDVAHEACLSPFHFHRLFAAIVGETPMSYLRRRRLSEAALRLKRGTESVLQVALSVGFDSQAAFTRAFHGYFGRPPQRFRKEQELYATHIYPAIDPATLGPKGESMKPQITERPAFVVTGMAREFTPQTMPQIPTLWGEFGPRMGEIPGRVEGSCLGMMIGHAKTEQDEPRCSYMACVETDPAAQTPEGMTRMEVPASRYAVFTYDGHISRIGAFIDKVWGEWFPASGLTRAEQPDFESYDERWNVATGEGPVDYYIPIV